MRAGCQQDQQSYDCGVGEYAAPFTSAWLDLLNQEKPEDLSLRNRALRPRACKQYQSNNYEKRIVSVVIVDTDADTSLRDVC